MLYSQGFIRAVPEMKQAVKSLANYPKESNRTPQWRMLGSMLSQALWDSSTNKGWHQVIYDIALRTGDGAALISVLISSVYTVRRPGRTRCSAATPRRVRTDRSRSGELRSSAPARFSRV